MNRAATVIILGSLGPAPRVESVGSASDLLVVIHVTLARESAPSHHEDRPLTTLTHISTSSIRDACDLPYRSGRSEKVAPPSRAPCITKLSPFRFGNS